MLITQSNLNIFLLRFENFVFLGEHKKFDVDTAQLLIWYIVKYEAFVENNIFESHYTRYISGHSARAICFSRNADFT